MSDLIHEQFIKSKAACGDEKMSPEETRAAMVYFRLGWLKAIAGVKSGAIDPITGMPNPEMQATGNDGVEKSESPARA